MKSRFLLITLLMLSTGLYVTPTMRAQEGPEGPETPPVAPQPAQPPQPEAQPQSQPQTSVARISVVHGQVSTMRGDGGSWVAATVNAPLVPGDQVATSDGSRAEVELDYANILRLAQGTDAKMADLEPNKIDIQLAQGLVDYTVYKNTQADAEIDTPNMGVHPLSPGIYRIQVTSPSETMLIVRQGEAEVLTNQGSTKVEAGQQIQIHGADNPEYKVDPAPGGDEFDKWCSNRDQQIQSPQALQHTNQYYTGAGDLDNYGQWSEVPDYGWCWTPQVDAGWVPYSAGSWGWEPYWGWTWISGEPWGWAPYHYGRWFNYGGAWRWWPAVGFGGLRPLWAPAYVSFFGFGGGFGFNIGFGFGSIGWLALGPRDIFHPWYGAGHMFSAMNFNAMHGAGFIRAGGPSFGSNLERAMGDARIRAAVRNVSAQDFAAGRMGRSMPVSEGMLRNASVMRGNLPMGPSRTSFGARAGGFSSYRGATANGQHFYSRGSAGSVGRAGGSTGGFGGRSNSVAPGRTEAGQGGWRNYSNAGRTGGGSTGYSNAGRAGGTSTWQGRTGGSTAGAQNNWQRYASPNPYAGRAQSGASTQRGGWQGYSGGSRGYSGGAGGWSGAAPRTGGSYGGAYNRGSYGGGYYGGSRAPMNLNQSVMRQRAPSGGYGGGRSYSAPRSGGSSAPRSSSGGGVESHSSGGGGGHSSGGGGGHSSGGGHSGGHR